MAIGGRGPAMLLAAGTLALAALAPVVVLTGGRAYPSVPGAAAPVPGTSSASASNARAVPQTRAAPRGSAAPTRWASVATASIRPGVLTDTAGGGRCTSNFVFVAGGRRFLGQAAHCAGTGVATETDGCASGTRPLGTTVTINAADGSRRTGQLAYSSWVTMQNRGETDPGTCAHNDFALVELSGADSAQVNPSLPVLGGPTGLRVGALPAGTPVFGYGGPSNRAAAGDAPGRTTKAGTAGSDVGAGFGHEIYTASPGVPGESGSAFVDADGAAFGVLTTLNLSAEPISNGATDLAAALAYANTHGELGAVTLAVGTEPFRPAPGSLG